MLNPFPLMWLSLLAYFILRIVVAFTFWRFGVAHLKARTNTTSPLLVLALGLGELVIAVMLFFGYLTQYACLGGFTVITLLLLFSKRWSITRVSRSHLVLLGAALASLFITGAGAFAFDLPL
jgi:uncharacterized membrane protein YphA (DoxX/SURF4 family)